jgi:uncharacterized repeat protein (TIGR03806 family)
VDSSAILRALESGKSPLWMPLRSVKNLMIVDSVGTPTKRGQMPLKNSTNKRILLALTISLSFACDGKVSTKQGADMGTDDVLLVDASMSDADSRMDSGMMTDIDSPTDAETDEDAGPDANPNIEFGLEERPANPTCTVPERSQVGDVTFERVFGAVQLSGRVMAMAQAPDGYWYAALRDGIVVRWANDESNPQQTQVLDITARVRLPDNNAELGLLGMAIHPDFATNGEIFLSYADDNLTSIVSRFTSSNGGQSFSDTEEILLSLQQPYSNHNGGDIHFGPDRMLYMSFGDGGNRNNGADDPQTWFGSILRIDPDGGSPYGIPADNPFADGVGGAPEVFAYGFRNPWRFTVDPVTGEVWAGDVGAGDWEEVDYVVPGGNYGWPTKEGSSCYQATSCDDTGMIDPVVEYSHDDGGVSVIGGRVYRGSSIPGLQGTYLFSEWSTGQIWAIDYDSDGAAYMREVSSISTFSAVTWAQGNDGEILIPSSGIRRMTPSVGGTPSQFPQTLSETGCVDRADPQEPASSMIPYGVNVQLWSDGAEKNRWMALPDGTQIDIDTAGDWQLPIGSVVMKSFQRDGQALETRLMMRHTDGDWAGYSYKWRDDLSDADLVLNGSTVNTPDGVWQIPSRGQCIQCHTAVSGQLLGLTTAQLNRDFGFELGQANQIATFDHIGLLAESPGAPNQLDAMPDLEGSEMIETRARAYLDVQCAHCHQPGGPGRSDLDLRWTTPLAELGGCDVDPVNGDLGIANAKLIVPGDPGSSVLSLRLHATDNDAMPPLGRAWVDETGTAVVDDWITGLSSCD